MGLWPTNRQHILIFLISSYIFGVSASLGDRLPKFQECLEFCKQENCQNGINSIPLLHRLLLWNCDSECDYTCQHIITDQRVAAGEPIVQFHGKWPFYRVLGMQEPFSVLFSFLNFLAHRNGLAQIKSKIPNTYSLRKYYFLFAYCGMASWTFSMIFHTRDYLLTEQLDYFAAGGSVLYGLYYTPIRIFRLDLGSSREKSFLRFWTLLCISLYIAHILYLKLYKWDYTYNMIANVVVGVAQNAMWSWFSVRQYLKSRQFWATWPGIVVTWILMAMSLELMDFPPLWGHIDAHSLWHLGTVVPTIIWYNFLLKDTQENLDSMRLKA
ncbi:putative post-gpi attachment factor 3 protein [Erysiphe necator]|uniref:Post-GPI attachment to proteins factor 3 n=1 Tax=Uncinula necator TaxID=52586 RepID=A0A0B1PGL5_UNCNE|nr:putative post-gpi attachment factor 3 protein [Erysiphe necator]